MLNQIRLMIPTLVLNKLVKKAGRPHKMVWSLTDDEPAWQGSDNPSHIDTSLDSELKPELLNQGLENWQRQNTALPKRVWGTAKGLLASFSGAYFGSCKGWLQQVLKEAMLRPSLQGNVFYDMRPLMGRWVGVQKTPEIAVHPTEDEWGMRDYISVYEKNKRK